MNATQKVFILSNIYLESNLGPGEEGGKFSIICSMTVGWFRSNVNTASNNLPRALSHRNYHYYYYSNEKLKQEEDEEN